ncbi:MAG: peptidylprolyl isomerase [Corynebacterium sp.]|nr:peptidylprolyl isomerase [Corynebacterium sp.]
MVTEPPAEEIKVPISSDIKQLLDALSEVTGKPAGYHVLEVLEEHLDALEWAYGVAECAERIRHGEEETFSAEEVDQALGLTGKPVDMSILDEVE